MHATLPRSCPRADRAGNSYHPPWRRGSRSAQALVRSGGAWPRSRRAWSCREDLNRPSPGSLDRLPHGGRGRDIPAVDRNPRTVLGEYAGNCRADATGTPGHQRDLVAQSTHTDGLAPEGVRLATTRPQISTATIETWYARSGTVRGPTPMAIVNSPTRVPSNANVWAARPIPRVNAGPAQVATHPMRRTPAITLSAVPAARGSYPVTKIPTKAKAAPT